MRRSLRRLRSYAGIFPAASQLEVQLVVCMPALFIVITNMFFGRLASRFGARTLTMVGLALYTVGGAAAGLFNSIWAVLVMRALVGVGVGMIMPLSTGLLTYYFAPEKREGLMGLSSAANQLGSGETSVLPRSRRERGVFAVYALRTGQNNE